MHFETVEQFLSLFIPFIVPALRLSGLYRKGLRNALDFRHLTLTIADPALPSAFDGFSILFLSDLHIDGNDRLLAPFCHTLDTLEVDLCLFGGDYRGKVHGDFRKMMDRFETFLPHIHSQEGIIGILGNHDSWEMIKPLERLGIVMLMNESVEIQRGDASIWVIGVDDPHYYRCDDYPKASQGVPADAFRILLAHSTGILPNLPIEQPVNFCLCGHTHAGQICLPVVGPVITHSKLKGAFIHGLWQYNGVKGYTTSGVGTSGIHVRYNTRPEFVKIVLQKDIVCRTFQPASRST